MATLQQQEQAEGVEAKLELDLEEMTAAAALARAELEPLSDDEEDAEKVCLPTQGSTFILAAQPGRGELVTFGFGRYKHQALMDVANSDPSYLGWMLGEGFTEDVEALVKAAQHDQLAGRSRPRLMVPLTDDRVTPDRNFVPCAMPCCGCTCGRRTCKDPIFAFGMHSGEPLKQVAREAPRYLVWMLSKDFALETQALVEDALEQVLSEMRAVAHTA